MKKMLVIMLIAVCGCTSLNEDNANTWIQKAEKPIVVKIYGHNHMTGEVTYTLMSSDGNFYNTGGVRLVLPDTIK